MDEARRGAGNNWVSKITVAVKTISERIQGYSNKLTEVERMLVMGIVSKRIAEQDTDSDGDDAATSHGKQRFFRIVKNPETYEVPFTNFLKCCYLWAEEEKREECNLRFPERVSLLVAKFKSDIDEAGDEFQAMAGFIQGLLQISLSGMDNFNSCPLQSFLVSCFINAQPPRITKEDELSEQTPFEYE
jgi:hypothetical protein